MDERESAFRTYFELARKKTRGAIEGLNKQFYAERLREIWSAFDGFLGWRFFDPNTQKKERENFVKKYQALFIGWKMSDQFKESLIKLKSMSPVTNMKTGKDVVLNDTSNLLEILDLAYAVRSNLDHGAKDLQRDDKIGVRNRELVEHSFKVTYEILEKTSVNEGINV